MKKFCVFMLMAWCLLGAIPAQAYLWSNPGHNPNRLSDEQSLKVLGLPLEVACAVNEPGHVTIVPRDTYFEAMCFGKGSVVRDVLTDFDGQQASCWTWTDGVETYTIYRFFVCGNWAYQYRFDPSGSHTNWASTPWCWHCWSGWDWWWPLLFLLGLLGLLLSLLGLLRRQGPVGPQGPQGVPGPQGPQGVPGVIAIHTAPLPPAASGVTITVTPQSGSAQTAATPD